MPSSPAKNTTEELTPPSIDMLPLLLLWTEGSSATSLKNKFSLPGLRQHKFLDTY